MSDLRWGSPEHLAMSRQLDREHELMRQIAYLQTVMLSAARRMDHLPYRCTETLAIRDALFEAAKEKET